MSKHYGKCKRKIKEFQWKKSLDIGKIKFQERKYIKFNYLFTSEKAELRKGLFSSERESLVYNKE